MGASRIDDVERLRRINEALISRVERSMDQQGNAFSLFQTAINLESRVRQHTEDLRGAITAALERAGIPAEAVEEVYMGQGRQAGSGPNPARQVARRANVPVTAPAQTINQACASGLSTVALAAQSIMLGQASIAVAGGEIM